MSNLENRIVTQANPFGLVTVEAGRMAFVALLLLASLKNTQIGNFPKSHLYATFPAGQASRFSSSFNLSGGSKLQKLSLVLTRAHVSRKKLAILHLAVLLINGMALGVVVITKWATRHWWWGRSSGPRINQEFLRSHRRSTAQVMWRRTSMLRRSRSRRRIVWRLPKTTWCHVMVRGPMLIDSVLWWHAHLLLGLMHIVLLR